MNKDDIEIDYLEAEIEKKLNEIRRLRIDISKLQIKLQKLVQPHKNNKENEV